MNQQITVLQNGQERIVTFDDCLAYHGRDSIGGLTLGFRLVDFALSKLAKFTLEEDSLTFDTAFAGPGIKDALEVTIHAVSRGAWREIDPTMLPQAPEGVYGRMWFAMTSGTSKIVMQLKPGVISDDFIKTGRAVKAGDTDPALLAHWTQVKEKLAADVAACDMNDILDTIIMRVPRR